MYIETFYYYQEYYDIVFRCLQIETRSVDKRVEMISKDEHTRGSVKMFALNVNK